MTGKLNCRSKKTQKFSPENADKRVIDGGAVRENTLSCPKRYLL
jgi:hypothetical protein